MAKEFNDIVDDLLKKVDNEEALEETSSVDDAEKLAADEFVALIQETQRLGQQEKKAVKGVRFNSRLYQPDKDGIVEFNQTSDSTSYGVSVHSDVSADGTYNIKLGAPFVVNVRYMALQITPTGERNNYRTVPGTLTIATRAEGASQWVEQYTQGDILSQSENYDPSAADAFPIQLDLGQYCKEGNQSVRVRLTTSYTDENDVEHPVTGDLIYSVNAVNLVVKNLTDFSMRILASDGGFPFSFAILGAVKKQLHVTMTGALGTWTPDPTEFAADVQHPESRPYGWTQAEINAYQLLSHGVHTVTAWLTCDDGKGGVLESDRIVNRFMIVNPNTAGADTQKPYLLLQEVQTEVTNYVRTVLTQFAVWVPSKENPAIASADGIDLSIRITDAGDGDTDYQREYYRSEQTCVSGKAYDVDTTIEIENTADGAAPASYQAYLRIFRYGEGGNLLNFMYESIRARFQVFTVDNSSDYSPVAGAHLYINPKVRNNSETNWQSIINQQSGEEVPSTWKGFSGVNDAWTIDENGVKVLRVLATQRLNIGYEPYEAFKLNPSASMSLEIDFAVRNITAEDKPVIDISQFVESTMERLGLRILPLTGAVWAQEKQTENDQDFGFMEDERTHMVVTLTPALVARSSDEFTWQSPNGKEEAKPTCKVYINGKHKRAVQYSVESTGVWITDEGHGGITIGNDNCDIDIYGLRCYRGVCLSAQNVEQNYEATRPTAEEKNQLRSDNDILDGNGRISISKVRAKGKRTLTWVGTDNYKINQDTDNGYAGYWDIYYCDDKGNYVPELSGTIGKRAYEAYLAGTLGGKLPLLQTAQGSTANTYWDNNGQTKCDKISYVVRILFSQVHKDFGWKPSMSDADADGNIANPMYLDGERIDGSAYANLDAIQKDRVEIDVIDGWFDGNDVYHGQFYTSAKGAAKATKLVNKINVASPQQSHKMGATRLYNDVMMAMTGGMSLHKENPAARFAVLEDSFYYFNQPEGQPAPVFRGLCTFGQGKADKPSWGYDKKKYPNMAMFEGANNNLPLCDFRVPIDEDVKYYHYYQGKKTESFVYNGVKSFEFDLGKTKEVVEDGVAKREHPTDAIQEIWKRYCNYVYSHDIVFECWKGTRTAFDVEYARIFELGTAEDATEEQTTALDEMQKTKYWIRDGVDAFHLIRFNYVTGRWVDAGTWNQETRTYSAGVRNLSTDPMTAEAYQQWLDSEDNGDYAALDKRFKEAIAKHFDQYFETVGHKVNHKTHYNLVNFFLAGTDNCSKNTYYTIDHETGLVWLYQDDLDTIMKTDNNGRQTKVYFLSRIHDKEDFLKGYKPQVDYEGAHNALFNVMEYAWEVVDNTALASNMRQILTVMAGLVNANDDLPGLTTTQKQTPWGCLHKYFFSIQKYFCANAYNEQQRIRYDFPASWGYESYGNQARGILAVTQGIGDQLEAEMQYMKRRLALICSYAAWGDFSAGVNSGSVGLDDTSSAFSLTPGSGRTGGEYTFNVVPHQFLYPCGSKDRQLVNPHVRVAPGESFALTIATAGNSISGDSSVGLAAINYYRSIGNVGNMVAGNNTITIQGRRLTDFVAEPAVGSTAFAPGQIQVSAPNLQRLSLRGLTTISGTLTLSSLQRLQSLDLRGTAVSTLRLPESSALTTLHLGPNLNAVALRNMPSLRDVSIEGFKNMVSLLVAADITALDTGMLLASLYEGKQVDGAVAMQTLQLYNIQVANLAGGILGWMLGIPNFDLTGAIEIYEPVGSVTPAVTFAMKLAMIQQWGTPDETVSGTQLRSVFARPSGSLSIAYRMRSLAAYWASAAISGEAYTHNTGDYQYELVNLNAYCNAFKSIRWAMTTGDMLGAEATIDALTGLLSVTKLSVLSGTTVLSVTVEPSDDVSLMPLSKPVGLYDRLAVEGDLVYADGTYSPVGEADALKTPVGLCCFVAPRAVDGNILPAYSNIEDKQLRLCVSLKDVTGASQQADGTAVSFASWQWGPYRSNTDTANGLYYNEGGTNKLLSDDSVTPALTDTTFYDLADIANFTSTGLSADPTNSNSASYVGDNNMRDAASEDGWKHGTVLLSCINDGFAYGETNADSTRKLNAALAALAGSTYKEGDIVNKGYANTLRIILQRNKILGGEGIAKVGLADQLAIPQAGANTTELQDLCNALCRVRDLMADMQGGSYTNVAKWQQLYFPAASACYAYEPIVKQGETLSPKLQRHNWFLPTIGVLMRLYWAHRMRTKSYAPLAKAMNDAILSGIFTAFTASVYWSSSEYNATSCWYQNFSNGGVNVSNRYNSYYVRALAAF